MVRKSFIISMVIFIALFICTAWAGPQMNPGKWEITTRTEMAGMPSRSVTHAQCITNNDLVPMSKDANQECQVTDIEVKGNTVSWKISCGGQGGGMEGTGQITYGGDSMEGTMHMVIAGANMQVTNHITGRRIGNCDNSTSGQPAASKTKSSDNAVGGAIAEDAKDVGQAAKDEAKQSTTNEVRESVKGIFKGLFK